MTAYSPWEVAFLVGNAFALGLLIGVMIGHGFTLRAQIRSRHREDQTR